MSLEDRLHEALHQTDDYLPSPDLFSRLTHSIEEDWRHRRRVRVALWAVAVGVVLLAGFAAAVAESAPGGGTVWPKWAVQVVMVAVMVPVLVVLGPALRRLGGPLIEDVFHMGPATGERFVSLLDIAYHIAFGAAVLLSVDLTDPGALVALDSEVVADALGDIARFLLALGLAHTFNLLVLPVIGLLHSSSVRRARRALLGSYAPPSDSVRLAERVAGAVVAVVILVIIAAVVALVVGVVAGIR